jgi:hypothetical protein
MSSFDEAGDRVLEPLRNHRSTNALFGFASKVGDFSLVWHVVGLVRAIVATSTCTFHRARFRKPHRESGHQETV